MDERSRDALVRLLPLPAYSYNVIDRVAIAPRRGLGALGLSLDIGGFDINTSSGGWSVTNPASGAAISSGTAPSYAGCPDPVPVQNAITVYVLAPISNAVSYNAQSLTQGDLTMLWNALESSKSNWLAFLHNVTCTDSRWRTRAIGAENTLAPYFQGLEAKIQLLQQTAASGGVTITPVTTYTPPTGGYGGGSMPPVYVAPSLVSGFSNSTLLLLAVGAYFLLNKPKG